MEPLLYFGFGGRNAGGRTIADDEAGRGRVLSSIECGAGRSDRIRTYDGMGCGSANVEGRMQRRERR